MSESSSGSDRKRKHYDANRQAILDKQKARRVSDPEWAEKRRAYVREYHRKRRGSPEAPDTGRSGPCEICGDLSDPLMWDHNHATGVERGWLCRACNSGLGMFKDSTERLEKAIAYLRRPR